MRRLVTVIALAMLAAGPLAAQTPAGALAGVLTASGQAEAKVTPDRAAVMVNVQTRASTAAASAAENATRTTAVFEAMVKLGLPRDQVTTQGYSVYPETQFNRDNSAPRVVSYVSTNTVRVETRRTEQVGSIIDAALGAGANLINGVSFYAASIEEPRRSAIAAAVASARADAEAMARAAGGHLGDLLELSTNGPIIPPRPMYDMAVRTNGGMAAQTPMNPGDQTVSVYVTGRWKYVP